MKINFAMWRKASWELIKMDDKKEWDALDVISKWLIATRSAVTTVTIYSCIIAGLLAWRDGYFSWIPFLIVTLALFIAHGANNLLNDYTDFSRGVDKDYYFRTQYGVHPLVQGFWTKPQQIRWFIISGFIAFIGGIYALYYTGFNPYIAGLFIFGALILLFYTWPLKYWALGELVIFLIWGPILIGGVYFVLALGAGEPAPANLVNVIIAGIPFGLSVASINIGKHIDKIPDDTKKGVGTFPVRAGEKTARLVNQLAVILIYAVLVYLVIIHYFTPLILIVFFAAKRALILLAVLSKPRPNEPPKEWPAWPVWFAGIAFYHNRLFGGLLILGLILDTVARVIPFTADLILKYWPM
jgi:1,4-dihydroxy-2-naphthoate octaprenyltransferase